MNRPSLKNRLDFLLAAAIVCLAALFLGRHIMPHRQGQTNDFYMPLADLVRTTSGHAGTLPAMPVGYTPQVTSPSRWIHAQPFDTLPCKSAVRLVELHDAFLVSLSVRNLATNSVRLSLAGSLLTIHTTHGRPDEAVTVVRHNIMLPAAIAPAPAPTYFLTNDLLKIRVRKLSRTCTSVCP